MNFPGKYVNRLNVCIHYPATMFMVSKRVTYLNSAKPKLSSKPSFLARKSVFWKVPNFPSRFFPRWKWYFPSNHDWKFSFLIPDGIPGKKSTISRILREYSQILQLVPRILKCTLIDYWLTHRFFYTNSSLYFKFILADLTRDISRDYPLFW